MVIMSDVISNFVKYMATCMLSMLENEMHFQVFLQMINRLGTLELGRGIAPFTFLIFSINLLFYSIL